MSPTATRYISERLSLFIKIIGAAVTRELKEWRLFENEMLYMNGYLRTTPDRVTIEKTRIFWEMEYPDQLVPAQPRLLGSTDI